MVGGFGFLEKLGPVSLLVAESGLVILAIILTTFIVLWQPARATFCDRAYDEDFGGWRLQSAGGLQQDQALPDFGPDGLKGLTEEQKKKILSGEVVLVSSHEGAPEGKSIISAALVFEVPVERAWAILSAPELQAEYLEEIAELKTVEQGPGYNRMFFLVKVMGQKVRYTVIHHFWPDQFYLWWELDSKEPHDLKELYGFWKLFRYDEGRTVARYGTLVKPAFPVPAFLRNWLSRSNVRHSLATVKKYVEGRK
ncbi:MAG: hypothetical protein HPY46_11610 [Candidatus Aminicenantes bacterium]|nr:hypothetical protein [Candidatus Aminicenantes bacterium]